MMILSLGTCCTITSSLCTFLPTIFPPVSTHGPSPFSKRLPVDIVGGGVAGLRIAILETLDISYRLFEVSDRYVGRAFTYNFKEKKGKV